MARGRGRKGDCFVFDYYFFPPQRTPHPPFKTPSIPTPLRRSPRRRDTSATNLTSPCRRRRRDLARAARPGAADGGRDDGGAARGRGEADIRAGALVRDRGGDGFAFALGDGGLNGGYCGEGAFGESEGEGARGG